jgi:hypothetical protein
MSKGLSRIRPQHRFLSEEEKENISEIKELAIELFDKIDAIPTAGMEDGRLKSLSLTSVEQSVMWATKCISTK